MKILRLITALLLLLPALAGAQIWKGVGIGYGSGPPAFDPGPRGGEVYIDTVSRSWYEYEPTTGVWRDAGHRIQLTNTTGVPNYTPSKARGRLALNSGDSLYAYQAGTWDCLNCVTASDTASYLEQDSILVYYVNGIEFDRDTIPFVTLTKILQIVSDSLSALPDSIMSGYGVAGYIPQYFSATKFDTTGLYWDSTTGRLMIPAGSGTGGAYMGAWTTSNDYFAIYPRQVTPSTGNYSFLHNSLSSYINAPGSGGFAGIMVQGTERARFNASTIGLNSTGTANTAVTIKGSGTTSSTTALLVENSAGTDMWLQRDDQVLFNYNKRMDWRSPTNSIGIGNNALTAEDQGSASRYNVAIGLDALTNTTTGSANVGLGFYALRNNVTGNDNLAIGSESLRLNTGTNNIGIGSTTMRDKTSGNNNVAIGVLAGFYTDPGVAITNSSNSVFIGYDTRPLANSQTNQNVIGYLSRGLGSNTTRIGNSSTTRTHLDGTLTVGTAANNVGWYTGTGSPESVVTANVGSIYTDIAGGASTTLYVKESGTGNTGWIAK